MNNGHLLPDIIRREPLAAQRHIYLKSRWDELYPDAVARDARASSRGDVQGANSFASTLVTQYLLDAAVTKLENRWASLKCYSSDFSTDPYKPLATAELKFVTAGATAQVNATNFESGDSIVLPCTITPSQYTQSFHVTNAELNSGLRMENLMEINMAQFADQVVGVVNAVITAANFPTPALVSTPGVFGWGDMQTAFGLLKKSPIKNAILDGEYLANIINVPTQFQKSGASANSNGAWAAFGWDNIAMSTNWAGADANVRGFLCGPTAIGCLSGLPVTSLFAAGHGLTQETITLPDIGISIAYHSWFSLSQRTLWNSFDIMFGASLLDGTAGILLKSA
jgi:hypothetical protein